MARGRAHRAKKLAEGLPPPAVFNSPAPPPSREPQRAYPPAVQFAMLMEPQKMTSLVNKDRYIHHLLKVFTEPLFKGMGAPSVYPERNGDSSPLHDISIHIPPYRIEIQRFPMLPGVRSYFHITRSGAKIEHDRVVAIRNALQDDLMRATDTSQNRLALWQHGRDDEPDIDRARADFDCRVLCRPQIMARIEIYDALIDAIGYEVLTSLRTADEYLGLGMLNAAAAPALMAESLYTFLRSVHERNPAVTSIDPSRSSRVEPYHVPWEAHFAPHK
jgi:hypothetical protein